MSDEEYFRSCVAKERHLAQLLGHEVEEYYESGGVLWEGTRALPQWTRDWAACGPLIALYDIALRFTGEDTAGPPHCVIAGSSTVRLSDHPSKDRAVMYAVVKAVICILEHHAELRHLPMASPHQTAPIAHRP
ncbi:aminoacyl-tRNA synthetase [Noviherbaspirillum saxi]|uniref:aminoacyl-tRNA synthetase n=1 Tax=Noviherbaspirillum saxi TaxID=2320863 RepID=UPI001F3D3B9B|nr:aminoacyl-tRNA synthetase [Noviherbaspirillum saxi]